MVFKEVNNIMANDKALHIKLPNSLYDALQRMAERKHISLASLVRMACSEWLEGEFTGEPVVNDNIDEIFAALPGVAFRR